MKTFFTAALIIVPALILMFSAYYTFRQRMQGRSVRKVMRVNVATFLILIPTSLLLRQLKTHRHLTLPQKLPHRQQTVAIPKVSGCWLLHWLLQSPVSAAVLPLPPAHRLPSPQRVKIRNPSVRA